MVWGASAQSNNCRQTAAACAKLGVECHLYLSRAYGHTDIQGNLLLDYLVGARVELVDAPLGPEFEALIASKTEAYRAAGRQPYAWERKRVKPLAAVGYVLCLIELLGQMRRQRLEPSAIYVCSAGSTGAGLAMAHAVLGLKCPLRLICPIRWPWNAREDMAEIANQTAVLLGLPHRLSAADIDATEDYVGPGYGTISPEGRDAMDMLARTEGILLDPIYSAKAMAGLIDDLRHQRLPSGGSVVFIHTGGQAAVFAYRDELMARSGTNS
jgi:1-aminocyclopropane-1-carboxylate deaminase/D-cysteine desulfhydrase-like pyridoxal-dependent ACC family enzyme